MLFSPKKDLTGERNFGLVASRISKTLIHVAEANGVPQSLMRNPHGLSTGMEVLMTDHHAVPWKDLVILGQRAADHFGNPASLVKLGQSYYAHLEHLPYTRLATTVLTLRGAFYLTENYTLPYNYEALICKTRWKNRVEAVKVNRLKYPDDPYSEPIALIAQGILEYFPTLFGREPMREVHLEIGEREASYHFVLPRRIGPMVFMKRAAQAVVPNRSRWKLLREQEFQLLNSQFESSRGQKMLMDLIVQSKLPLVLIEDGKLVFSNRSLETLLGEAIHQDSLPFHDIASQMQGLEGGEKMNFTAKASSGIILPLEATLSSRLAGDDKTGRGTLLMSIRDRREPETRQEAITLAREDERCALAKDLHDGLGQTLSGLAYRVAALSQQNPSDPALLALGSGISSALSQARQIAHAHHASGNGSIIEPLRLACIDCQAIANLPVNFLLDATEHELADLQGDSLEMILKESLANALRHSGASRINVSLVAAGNQILLEIQDDGCGLPADHRPGFGCASIRCRADAMNATVEWLATHPGTLVRCKFPRKQL